MSNIPKGYDENGSRCGVGQWTENVCPDCGSEDVWLNGSDEMQCDSCGYEECGEEYTESLREEFNARYLDKNTGKWSDWKVVVL